MKSLITYPGLNGEPTSLPDGPAKKRKVDRATPVPSLVPPEREAAAEALARYYRLPRHEVIRLEHQQKIAWVMAALGVSTADDRAREMVESVIRESAFKNTPRRL